MAKRGSRLWALVLLAMAVVALVVVAASLRHLEFSAGYLLPREGPTEEPLDSGAGSSAGTKIFMYLMIVFYGLAVVLLPFAVVYLIKYPAFRRRLLAALTAYLWVMAAVFVLSRRPDLLSMFGFQMAPAPNAPTPTDGILPELPPAPSAWLVWTVASGLTAALIAVLLGAVWLVWRRRPRHLGPLEQLAEEAQQAVAALESGADLHDTIIRCYFEMGRVLREERDLRRASAMTPREFEKRLAEAGLPETHIRQLTRLFEAVRYGAKQTDEHEQRQAVACLTAIVEACRSRQ